MEKREHYSERLGRNFAPGDWLFAAEALEVLSTNAGRRVSDANLSVLRASGIRSQLLSPRRRVYLYDDLCDVVIHSSAGRPRDESVSQRSNIRAQRAYRDRQRKLKEQALHEKLEEYRADS